MEAKFFLSAAIAGCVAISPTSARPAHAPLRTDFPDLVARVSPAVVNIQTTKILKNSNLQNYVASLAGKGAGTGLENSQSSLGTGFVVASTKPEKDADGNPKLQNVIILTNEHVISQADEIEVMLAGSQERFRAELIARDPRTDLAVLRASLPTSLKPLRLGASAKTRVGEAVFAIGNPFGLGHTVTSGILSAKDRGLGISRADRYLQTDAAINFGNSGGPLFNMRGEVIGINTLVRVDAQGIGFAIPADTVKSLLPELEKIGRVERAWLGVVAANESTALRRRYGIQGPLHQGVVVTHLVKDAPAHKIEMEEGDLITAIVSDGKTWPTNTVGNLREAIDRLRPGSAVEIRLRRGAKSFVGSMKLQPFPDEERLPEGHDYY